MLITAFAILGVAVLLGLLLAILYLRTGRGLTPPRMLAPFHGLLAITGFICLVLALGGPHRQAPVGTASFGTVAIVLFVLAILIGGTMFAARLRKKSFSQMTIGVHATLAVGGFVVLAAYIFAG
jgi:hypothetical protein